MDTSSSPSASSKKPSKRVRSKHKSYIFPARNDFEKHIRYLEPDEAADFDRLRDDLQESIEKVVRVQHAFVKELNKHAVKSNRIKSIVQAVGEIPFHCDLQRKILSDGVTHILESKAILAKRQREEAAIEAAIEAAKKKRAIHEANCICCLADL